MTTIKAPPHTSAPTATNRTTARLRSGALVQRWNREGGKEGNVYTLPGMVPYAFLEDVVSFQRMHADGGVACAVHGMEHQEDMSMHWPTEWMLWLFQEVGAFTYYNAADEAKRIEEAGNPFRRQR